MTDGETQTIPEFTPRRPGEQLRSAREAQGLDMADVAARTRIPQRHLEAVEAGSYSSLPSATYAVGFARAYARAVGADEVGIAAAVRDEVAGSWDRPGRVTPAYEIEDPRRTPSRGLVWAGVLVALLVLVGVGLWYGTDLFRGGSAPSSVATAPETDAVPIPATVAPAPPATQGQVTITATDEVWLRVSDADGKTLFIKTMAPGERYDVPADANQPKINVGRPDKIAITVNGSAVPPLGDGSRPVSGVEVSAKALLARINPAAAAAPAAATPAAAPTPRPSATPTPRATPSSSPTPRASPSAPPPPPAFAEPTTGNGTE